MCGVANRVRVAGLSKPEIREPSSLRVKCGPATVSRFHVGLVQALLTLLRAWRKRSDRIVARVNADIPALLRQFVLTPPLLPP